MLMTSCCAEWTYCRTLFFFEALLANVLLRMGRGVFLSTLECPQLLSVASHAHDLPAFRTCYATHFSSMWRVLLYQCYWCIHLNRHFPLVCGAMTVLTHHHMGPPLSPLLWSAYPCPLLCPPCPLCLLRPSREWPALSAAGGGKSKEGNATKNTPIIPVYKNRLKSKDLKSSILIKFLISY